MPYRDPAYALRLLQNGNIRFMAGEAHMLNHDLAGLRERTSAQQRPVAVVLACSDSRVPVELVFDQSIGSLFVIRIAGNLVTPEVLGSVEYATVMLEASLVVVLGHQNCGAIAAAVVDQPLPGNIGTLMPPLRKAVQKAGGDADASARHNATLQAEAVAASPVVGDLVKQEKVRVVPAYYELASGEVTWL